MNRFMLAMVACLALHLGFNTEVAQAQGIIPMISLNSSETRSGHVPNFEPHLFLTPKLESGQIASESSSAIAVRFSNTKRVLSQIFLTGVISRPEKYDGLGDVYAVIHQRPIGFVPPSRFDNNTKKEAQDDFWVKSMEYSSYRRLADKRVQYLEATPAEVFYEIPRPTNSGTYLYIVQIAGEWRVDSTTGMPVLPIALREASKSTKYSPLSFRIDWLSDEAYDRLAGITRSPAPAVKNEGSGNPSNGRIDENQKEKPEREARVEERREDPPAAPKLVEWSTKVDIDVTRWEGDPETGHPTNELRKGYHGRFAYILTGEKPNKDMQAPVSPSEEKAPKGVTLGRITGGHAEVNSPIKASGPVWVVIWITCDNGWSSPRWAKIEQNQSSARVRFPLCD